MSISVNEIRKDFPLLENQKVIYLDTAATSQKPACVLEAEREFYEKYNANPLRGLYELGEAATEKYEEARETVREFLNAREAAEIVFVRNATEGLNLVAYSFGSLVLKPGDEILVSIMEHTSCVRKMPKNPHPDPVHPLPYEAHSGLRLPRNKRLPHVPAAQNA
jgi:cysteine desulfurase/selenocysteine lyase